MQQNLKIIASLAKYANGKNNEIRAIASIVQYPYEISIEEILKNSKFLYKETLFFNNTKFIVLNLDFWEDSSLGEVLINKSYLKFYNYNIFRFIKDIQYSQLGLHDLFKILQIRSARNRYELSKIKDVDVKNLLLKDNMENSQLILIINGITWSNILFMFRIFNINIYSGSTSRRHLLSTVELNLVKFLQIINNMLVLPDIIYKSFSEFNTSNAKYEKILSNLIKSLPNSLAEIKKYEGNYNLDFYIKYNLLLKFILELIEISKILKNYESEISELNNQIEESKKRIANIKTSNYNIDFYSKKLKNSNNLIQINNDKIKNLRKLILEKRLRIDELSVSLYQIESSFFDENGIFIFDNSIKIELNIAPHNISTDLKKSTFANQKREYSTVRSPAKPHKNNKEPVFSYLNFINEIISKSNNDLIKSQKDIELSWFNYVKAKLDNYDSKTRNNLGFIIKKANETLNLHLKSKQIKRRFPKIYNKLKKEHLIIAFTIILNYYYRLGFTSIAIIISRNIIFNIYYEEILKRNKEDNVISLENFEIYLELNDKSEKLKLGSFFIEIFCLPPTDIFIKTYKNIEDENDPISILEINEDYIDSIQNNFLIPPTSLPMICKPNNWSDTKYGGFLSNILEQNDLITGSKEHKHAIENRELLYNTINYLNSIKFKINNDLLTFLEGEGKFLWDYYLIELKNKNKILQANITLNIAKSYSNFKYPLYLSAYADWRGRIYTQSFYISYQAGDLSSALLNFYECEKITEKGLYYLYIYGANCYNENNIAKSNYDTRIEWVKSNYKKIINLDKEFLLKADSKFLFTAFCLTLKNLNNNPEYKVCLPVFLDATCSGIQHLAALLKDFDTGSKVNLIPQNENDVVGDIYSDLIDPINKAINNFGIKNVEYEKFKYIKLERKHIKVPIMTKVYNVSIIGIANQLRNIFKNNSNIKDTFLVPTVRGAGTDNNIKLNYYEIYILAKIIYDQIFHLLPSLKTIYIYFTEVIKIIVKLNIPLFWITPSGMKITQFYSLSKLQKVSITFGKKSNTVILRENLHILDKAKQKQAIIPNIIHSLDASHLINIINTASSLNLEQIISVHDCFGTHPNHLEQLVFLVKKEFILLYTNSNFLELFHNRFIQSLKDNHFNIYEDNDNKLYIQPKITKIYLPELPKFGKLEIEKIIDSKYMIT